MSNQTTPNCTHARRALLSDPGHIADDIQQHLQACHRCTQFAHELSCLDTDIQTGLNIKVPDKLADRILLAKGVRQSRHSNRLGVWLKGVAASAALLMTSIGSYLYLSAPLLVEEIALAHVRDELHHLIDKDNIELAQLNNLLEPLNIRMRNTSHTINYAGSCKIHGSAGVHVVLQGERAPVTLLFMPGEHIKARKTIEDNSFKGVVLPLAQGSLAIVADKQETLEPYEQRIQEQLTTI